MRSWHCHPCGREWKTPDHVKIHWHASAPTSPRAHRSTTPPDQFEGGTLEELMRRVYADLPGGYQPPTIEEARAETGETGRRRPGTGYVSDDDGLEL